MSQSLTDFYDARYAAESEGASRRTVAPARWPADRFENCVSRFPELWRGGHLLELAAGNGLVARSLIDAGLDIESYTLSERSEARLAGLEQSVSDPRVRTLALDAEDVPDSEHGRYDAVLMVALVEHLVDPLGAMQRIRRLLKPGGFVYLDTPNVAKYTRRAKLLFGRFPATSSFDEGLVTYAGEPARLHDEGHLHYFTWRSLSKMLVEHCGFARVQPLPYFSGGRLLGRRADHTLARLRPQLFSEVCLAAWA